MVSTQQYISSTVYTSTRSTTRSTTSTPFIATTKETTKEVARPKAATFVVAKNRVDVVELAVDLDVDLVDVDLAVSLCDGPRSLFRPRCSD